MTVKKDPEKEAQSVIAAILAGRVDSHLVEVVEAIESRTTSDDGPRLQWQVGYDGLTLTQAELTLGDGRFIESTTGAPFASVIPKLIVLHRQAIAACALARRDGMDRKVAYDKLDEVPIDALTVVDVEVAPDPLETSSPST